jgi:putative ABC transport system ATP-binding protein
MNDPDAIFRPGGGQAASPPGSDIIATGRLSREYVVGTHTVAALGGIDLEVEPGSLVAIQGRSGSGKTTLLNLLGGLDRPTSGTVRLDGDELTELSETELVQVRRDKIGFIFQAFGLIPILTARENVEIPMRLAQAAVTERAERSRILLNLVGLGDRAEHRPHELSGGEQQRVAIARALANRPKVLLADEPTGQLDSTTGRMIMDLIHALVVSEGVTAIVATHDPALVAVADRVIELSDGRIVADSSGSPHPTAP